MSVDHIVQTAFKRPHYMRQAVDSWNSVRGIEDIPKTVFLEPSDRLNEIYPIASEFGNVFINPRPYGVLVNPWKALNYAFEDIASQFVILAEEDLIVSSDILEYFNWASKEFVNDTSVLGVCAHSGAGRLEKVELSSKFNVWVWGTWADRWFNDLRETWDGDYSSGREDNTPSGWDWNIELRITKGRHWIKPEQTRSAHIGRYEGTHMTEGLWEDHPNFIKDIPYQVYNY